MDEPFSGLDLMMLEKTCKLLVKIANMDDLNTIITITHDINAAASISDRLWLMGRESDEEGNKIDGARIIKDYSLIDRGLAWQPNIQQMPEYSEFMREIKEEFRRL